MCYECVTSLHANVLRVCMRMCYESACECAASERGCIRMCFICCDSNFICLFFLISGQLCLCFTAVNQCTATSVIMSQDFDGADADDLFDSPTKPLDLKTCNLFKLPAVDTSGLSLGWRCRHCGGSWKKRNSTKVVAHLAGIRHESINVCDFSKTMPSKEEQAAYQCRGNLWRAGKSSRAFRQEVIDNHLTDRHDAIVCLDDVRKGDSGVRLFDDDDVPKQGYVPRYW